MTMRAEDLLELTFLGDTNVSGDQTAVTMVTTDPETNRTLRRIAVWRSGAIEPVTDGPLDERPRWSPDGARILFVRRQDDGGVASVVDPVAREVRPLPGSPTSVLEAEWSPSGTHVGILALDQPPNAHAGLLERFCADVRVIRDIPFKTDDGFIDRDRRRGLVMVDARAGGSRTVSCEPADHASLSWSPDGRQLAATFATFIEGGFSPVPQEAAGSHVSSGLCIAGPDGSGRHIHMPGRQTTAVAWAPDSGALAFVWRDLTRDGYGSSRISILYPGTDRMVDLAEGWLGTIGDASFHDSPIPPSTPLRWSKAGILAIGSLRGYVRIYRFGEEGGRPRPLTPKELTTYAFDVRPKGKIVSAAASALDPGDLYLGARRLTAINETVLARMGLTRPARLTTQAPGGPRIQGWLLRGSAPSVGTIPLIASVRGGPQAMYTDRFNFEYQLLAAAGLAVAWGDPRGSLGYGDAFCAAIRGNWGEHDHADLHALIDAAISTDVSIDATRIGIGGGSYGAWLTCWALAHSDRFQVGVASRGPSNRLSFVGTSAFGFRRIGDHYGTPPWDDPEPYLRESPIMFARRITAPLLIEHGEDDQQAPIGQAEELFTALRFLGRETVLVRYPRANHGMIKNGAPWHRVHRLRTITGWYLQHLSER